MVEVLYPALAESYDELTEEFSWLRSIKCRSFQILPDLDGINLEVSPDRGSISPSITSFSGGSVPAQNWLMTSKPT